MASRRVRCPRQLAAAAVAAMGLATPAPAQTPSTRRPAPAAPAPYVVEYYYKARWGHADEFLELFRKNHLPLLRRRMKTGSIVDISIAAPRYHGTEEGRWDYRVTIAFRDVVAANESSPTPVGAELAELFPDTAAFRREERRRFEILAAHWDVPIADVGVAP
jgi:hypothetical protein